MEFSELLRWAASITGMIAAIMVAANAGSRITGIGFVVFCLSSLIWITTSIMGGNNPLALQNIVLLGINVFGVYRYLWRSEDGEAPTDAERTQESRATPSDGPAFHSFGLEPLKSTEPLMFQIRLKPQRPG